MGQSNVPIQSGAFVIGPLPVEDARALIERIARLVAGPAAAESVVTAIHRAYGDAFRVMMPGLAVSTPVGDVTAVPTAATKSQPRFPYDIWLAPDGENLACVVVLPRDGADSERLLETLNTAVKAPDILPSRTFFPSATNLWGMWSP